MPSTLTLRKCSSGTFISCWAAARWMSASAPRNSSGEAASSSTLLSATSAPARASSCRLAVSAGVLVMPTGTTSWPAARARNARREPMKPVPPVIRIRICLVSSVAR